MPSAWSAKDERQYKHVLASCERRGRRSTRVCKRIAGATVNKQRSAEGRTLRGLSDDTRRALLDHPDYWLSWYTFKSLALVGAVGVVGYLLGKEG